MALKDCYQLTELTAFSPPLGMSMTLFTPLLVSVKVTVRGCDRPDVWQYW